jgi:c-di-GMP-binding flagellar brake protein YcgR
MAQNTERRRHKRAFFTLQDKIPVTIIRTGEQRKTITGNILSISSGGISVVVKRHEVGPIKEGDRIVVFSACLPDPVGTLTDIETYICYLIDYNSSAMVAMGCCFLDISDSLRDNIQRLVKAKSKILDK